MQNIDGWWLVDHDHVSSWVPKEEWIEHKFGKEGVEWISISGEFAFNTTYENADKWPGRKDGDMIRPLRWGFTNKNDALLFLLVASSL